MRIKPLCLFKTDYRVIIDQKENLIITLELNKRIKIKI